MHGPDGVMLRGRSGKSPTGGGVGVRAVAAASPWASLLCVRFGVFALVREQWHPYLNADNVQGRRKQARRVTEC